MAKHILRFRDRPEWDKFCSEMKRQGYQVEQILEDGASLHGDVFTGYEFTTRPDGSRIYNSRLLRFARHEIRVDLRPGWDRD